MYTTVHTCMCACYNHSHTYIHNIVWVCDWLVVAVDNARQNWLYLSLPCPTVRAQLHHNTRSDSITDHSQRLHLLQLHLCTRMFNRVCGQIEFLELTHELTTRARLLIIALYTVVSSECCGLQINCNIIIL